MKGPPRIFEPVSLIQALPSVNCRPAGNNSHASSRIDPILGNAGIANSHGATDLNEIVFRDATASRYTVIAATPICRNLA
jgi:hypothetical protein